MVYKNKIKIDFIIQLELLIYYLYRTYELYDYQCMIICKFENFMFEKLRFYMALFCNDLGSGLEESEIIKKAV